MEQTTIYIAPVWILQRTQRCKERLHTGGTVSPIILNLRIDAVIRKWKSEEDYRGSVACFYADDGLVDNKDLEGLQASGH